MSDSGKPRRIGSNTGNRPGRVSAQGQAFGQTSRARKPHAGGKPARHSGWRFADVVAGKLDEATAATPQQAPAGGTAAQDRRVLAPHVDAPKLHKVLAQAGLGARLEMERLIAQGRIAVNGAVAHIGQRVQYGDQIQVDGRPVRVRLAPPPVRVLAYHKPVGEVVTHGDPQNRPTVFARLPRLAPGQGKWLAVGRLDLNTEGLLLLTNSGDLVNRLMHPRFGLEREYAVRVLGALDNAEKQRLLQGVQLDDGMAAFGSMEDGGGEGANCWYRVTIAEGRNREVRRMFEALGRAVSRLIRIRYGAMMLPRGLRRGAWMELDGHDLDALMRAAHVSATVSSTPLAAKTAAGQGRATIGADSLSRQRKQQRTRQRQQGGGAWRKG